MAGHTAQRLHHAHRPDGAHEHEGDQADLLDLDAEVVGHLDELVDWAGRHAAGVPSVVVDVGAGTGTGTLALARRFDSARLVAIDESTAMLERLGASAEAQGLRDRLRLVQADLDAGWPDTGTVDLAWAASSLHHVEDPDRVLRDVHAALAPGGLLVVVEMDGMPHFLPADLGAGRPGLEDRVRAAMAADHWNAHPNWSAHLQRAGFAVVEERTSTWVRHPTGSAAHRYARGVFSRVRSGLADRLDADDLATLDRLLAHDTPESLSRRRDLVVRSSRTAWAARRA